MISDAEFSGSNTCFYIWKKWFMVRKEKATRKRERFSSNFQVTSMNASKASADTDSQYSMIIATVASSHAASGGSSGSSAFLSRFVNRAFNWSISGQDELSGAFRFKCRVCPNNFLITVAISKAIVTFPSCFGAVKRFPSLRLSRHNIVSAMKYPEGTLEGNLLTAFQYEYMIHPSEVQPLDPSSRSTNPPRGTYRPARVMSSALPGKDLMWSLTLRIAENTVWLVFW